MHGGKKTDMSALKKGGMAKGYADGGTTVAESPEKKANKAADNLGSGLAKKAVDAIRENKRKKEQALKDIEGKLACGGKVKKMAKGGGIESKGKTRGRFC
jgi:hypothetical protein